MKKAVLLVIVLGLSGLIAFELLSRKQDQPPEKKDQPLAVKTSSGEFNASFSKLMKAYFGLKDALVDWDTVAVDKAAGRVQAGADSLELKELKADSSILQIAQNLASSISSEAQGLAGENSLEQKRRAFNAMTDELYNLIRTVRYAGEIIYYIKCPMAFSDSSEAYWLSNTRKIVNPYLGNKHPLYKNKMLGCGELIDSLSFTSK
jgi:hypothetical protein